MRYQEKGQKTSRWFCGIVVGALSAFLLTGCGDGSEEVSEAEHAVEEVTAEPLLSDTERAICDYETKYSTGTFTMEDYQALAGLYQEVGMIRKQRDMLEQSYRLYRDETAFAALQNIAVNLAEEDAEVRDLAQTMLNNLEIPEYQDEAVNLISTATWFDTMMPKLYEGCRSYFLEQNGQIALTIQAGYDDTTTYSNVWYLDSEDKVTLLCRQGETLRMLQTQFTDGDYNGSFEAWTLDGMSGTILQENGTFTNGVYTGDYTARVHSGTTGSDLFSLWSNREGMEYVTYTGHFDEAGVTTLEQPDQGNIERLIGDSPFADCIVYAYEEGNTNCLFKGLEQGVEKDGFCFQAAGMGLAAYPQITVYEVTQTAAEADLYASDTSEETETPNIRIYDGEVQWFNGSTWVSAGTVKGLSLKDPFRSYAENRPNTASGSPDEGTGAEGTSSTLTSGVGSLTTATPAPAPTKKPSQTTQKPAQTPKPTAAPTPAPTPAPAQDDHDDDNNDNNGGGGSDSGGNDTGGGNTDAGGSDSGSTGGDVDIEWTDDIL